MTTRRTTLAATGGLILAGAGCQQKMAEQPSPRPYEQHPEFAYKQAARPMERGTMHRNQPTSDDPMVQWLTAQGREPKVSPEWKAAVNDSGNTQPTAGAPTSVDNYVKEMPFEITSDDLARGQRMYNAVCAVCHGGAGYGNGKIPERGFLKPPSYHTDISPEAKDAGYFNQADGQIKELPVGYSRGFDRYGIRIPLREVPVGYIYQVITWGYNGMGSHETQVPIVADRWRIIAYVRALQLSQHVPVGELSASTKKAIEDGTALVPEGDVSGVPGKGTPGKGVTGGTTTAGDGPGSIKRSDH